MTGSGFETSIAERLLKKMSGGDVVSNYGTSREGSTNNYFISGGITINDIDYNNVNEWNYIYNWLDGYFINNLDSLFAIHL